MADELGGSSLRPTPAAHPHDRPHFRIHWVTCPRCGQGCWFILFSERTPEEVEQARQFHERRLLSEPCERHRYRLQGRAARATA